MFSPSYCTDECPGYRQPPYAGSLWPGETEAEFGYPVGDDGTRRAARGEEREG
jgi:hypothetical protein